MSKVIREFNDKSYHNESNAIIEQRDNGELEVTLTYPDVQGKAIQCVVFDQESVRASDGIKISYDYDRDGYQIEQASRFAWGADDPDCDPDWQEVAFIPSWGREETEDEKETRISEQEKLRNG